MGTLLIHAGLPKTATSALQWLFQANRDRLAAHGILYPDRLHAPEDPRHYFLQRELATDPDFPVLRAVLSEAEAADHHTVLLSTEGVSGKSCLITPETAAGFAAATRGWRVRIFLVMRPAEAWLTSLYRQHVVNPARRHPATNPLEALHATGQSFEAWRREPELAVLSDPEALTGRFRRLFPDGEIVVLDYGDGIVARVSELVGLALDPDATQEARRNVMPEDPYIEVLRRVNATPLGPWLNRTARAALVAATGSEHLELAKARPAGRLRRLALHALLGTLAFRDNPPLKVTRASFDAARRAVRAQALARSG